MISIHRYKIRRKVSVNKLLRKLLRMFIGKIESERETTFDKDWIDKKNPNGITVNQQALHNKVTELINNILKDDLPSEVKGMAFILHSDFNNKWELDILGTYNKKYKPQDDDWACDEDCIPLADTFKWTDSINKKQLIQSMGLILQDYLLQGEYVNKLKTLEAVGLSFDDGDMNFLYLNQ